MRLGAPRIRRASLRWLVVATTLSLAVAACSPSATPSPAASTGATTPPASTAPSGARPRPRPRRARPPAPETVVVKAFRKPDALIGNHYIASSDALISDGVHQLVNEPLFYFDYAKGDVVPWTAESYEYNADNTEITHPPPRRRDLAGRRSRSPPTTSCSPSSRSSPPRPRTAPRTSRRASTSADRGRSADREDHAQRAEPAVRPDGPVGLHLHRELHPGPEARLRGQDFATFAFYDLAKGWPFGTGPVQAHQLGDDRSVLDPRRQLVGRQDRVRALPAAPGDLLAAGSRGHDHQRAREQRDRLGRPLRPLPGRRADRDGPEPVDAVDQRLRSVPVEPDRQHQGGTVGRPRDALGAQLGARQGRLQLRCSTRRSTRRRPGRRSPSSQPHGQARRERRPVHDLPHHRPTTPTRRPRSSPPRATARTAADAMKDGKPLTVRLSIFDAATLGAVWTTRRAAARPGPDRRRLHGRLAGR